LKPLALTIAICTALLAAGCGGGGDSTTAESTAAAKCVIKAPAEVDTKTKPKVEIPECEPPSTLVIKDLKKGSGKTAKPSDTVTVQYVGLNFKTGEEFDSSWSRHEPASFPLEQVIPGWTQGMAGMKVGGRRELIIPPALGYGEAGSPPTIPPNETLVFVIDLLAVH
jgi:peptidylprolyl isomerase